MSLSRLLLFVIMICGLAAQAKDIDSLGFVSPVDHQIRLTGNFMELRTNHFHAGIDIKSSKGVAGDNIRSVHNGHISRIKVQTGGYGNALYIDHTNGYTSVYAHLLEFSPAVQSYVHEIQYATQSFEVDIYLPDSLFSVQQSELIGKMGNTGRSFGPHLHFELRETAGELPVNPESLGIGPTDKVAPVLESLHLHSISSFGEITEKDVRYFKSKSPIYTPHENTIEINSKRVGLGLQMYDRMDGSWNKNGVYGYQVKVDNKILFSWKADKFSFDQTRYINGFWDYERQWSHGQKVYLLYKQSCNSFSYYNTAGDGILDLSDGVAKRVEIIVTDLHKNHSKVEFNIIGKTNNKRESVIRCDSLINISSGQFDVSFHENAFYSPYEVKVESTTKQILGQSCQAVIIGDNTTSVNGYYTIKCQLPSGDPKRWTMVSQDSRGRYVHFGGDTLNGQFVAKVDQLGTFALYEDKEAPSIKVISFNPRSSAPWKFKVKDNLIDDGMTDEINYRATLDGQWLRMNYDKKNDVLIFSDFNRLTRKTGTFQLEVWDHCGNKASYLKNI